MGLDVFVTQNINKNNGQERHEEIVYSCGNAFLQNAFTIKKQKDRLIVYNNAASVLGEYFKPWIDYPANIAIERLNLIKDKLNEDEYIKCINCLENNKGAIFGCSW